MSEDYYKTLIKDIIENNDKEKATKIIANKLNEKQISNEKEMLNNLDKDKEIEKLKDKIISLETERDVLKSTLSETKADIKYLLQSGEGNGYIRNKYLRK